LPPTRSLWPRQLPPLHLRLEAAYKACGRPGGRAGRRRHYHWCIGLLLAKRAHL